VPGSPTSSRARLDSSVTSARSIRLGAQTIFWRMTLPLTVTPAMKSRTAGIERFHPGGRGA